MMLSKTDLTNIPTRSEMMGGKTYVADIDRSRYDFRFDEDESSFLGSGLTEEIVREISQEKGDPEWMRDLRLHSLDIYNKIGRGNKNE